MFQSTGTIGDGQHHSNRFSSFRERNGEAIRHGMLTDYALHGRTLMPVGNPSFSHWKEKLIEV